jgi:hypothetical protein
MVYTSSLLLILLFKPCRMQIGTDALMIGNQPHIIVFFLVNPLSLGLLRNSLLFLVQARKLNI